MNKKDNTEPMLDKMVLVANLYYKSKLSQQDIAGRLNISRPWVSKLLSRAEELGIVKIEIHSPSSGNSNLEKQLEQKYGISHAGVVPASDDSRDQAAAAAATYFVSQIQPEDVIGIGWGDAVSRFIQQLFPMQLPGTQVIPMAGSFGTSATTLPNYIAMQLADRLGGSSLPLHVPAFCSTAEEYDALNGNQRTRDILAAVNHADIAVFGIGSFTSSFLLRHKILSLEEQKTLTGAGAIGDVTLHFINRHGAPVDCDLSRRIIRADLPTVRSHARTVIGIAQGAEKFAVIKAALIGGLVDAFFTDETTAAALL